MGGGAVHVCVYCLLHVARKLQATTNTTIIICKSIVNGSCIIFYIPIIESNIISYPRGTTTMAHHDDACTLFIPCFKNLFSLSGVGVIVGTSTCANGTYSVNTTLNNSIASLISSLYLLQHISITTIIRTTTTPFLKLATMAPLRVHYSHLLLYLHGITCNFQTCCQCSLAMYSTSPSSKLPCSIKLAITPPPPPSLACELL